MAKGEGRDRDLNEIGLREKIGKSVEENTPERPEGNPSHGKPEDRNHDGRD